MTEAERLDWIRLIRTEQVGPVTFHQLIERFGSAGAALRALPDLAQRGGRKAPLRIPAVAEAERELAAHARIGATLLTAADPAYPEALRACDDAPPILTAIGDIGLLARPKIALVGARNASVNARRFTQALAQDLGRAGLVVVSGLARGIDAAAHAGALDQGTIAVVAGGADVFYPPENRALQAAIGERGLIVAEMPPGTEPQARHFPRRNRIISGLSLGVVVVEAALRSGSLITARLAGEQGREVFAVPGSPLDARCRGTNGLLRDGAHLVETADDVLAVIGTLGGMAVGGPRRERLPTASPPPIWQDLSPEAPERGQAEILEMLDAHPVAIDELVRRCHMSPAVLHTVLFELELAGRLERHPGNRVALALQT